MTRAHNDRQSEPEHPPSSPTHPTAPSEATALMQARQRALAGCHERTLPRAWRHAEMALDAPGGSGVARRREQTREAPEFGADRGGSAWPAFYLPTEAENDERPGLSW